MKDNETLKKTLLHYINLEYYANQIDVEFQTLLEELESRCTKAILSQKSLNTKLSYNTLMKVIKEEVEKFRQLLEERLEEEAENIMNLEQEFLDETYNKNGGIKGTLLTLGGITASRVLFAPIAGSETVKQFVEKTGKNIYRSYDTSLRSGYLFGQSTEDINNQVENKLKQVSRGMQSGIRTAIPSFAKTTDRIIFLNNNVEVIWVATLDGRTCINCAGLSGIHFKSITEAPSVPQHFSCRCTLCPVATISEPIPDFKEFIESLSEEEQKHVLGIKRFELWKQYNVSLDKFNNNGTIIPKDKISISENVKKQIINDNTAKLVKKYYPEDTFIQRKISDSGSLYVSKERIKSGIKDPAVYNFDKLMATTLVKEKGLDLYLLTENGGLIGTKHPDGFYIEETIEMKHVTGSLRKVGVNAVRALKQSPNVFVYVDNNYSINACLEKIHGSIKNTRVQMGEIFIEPNKDSLLLIFTNGKLYEYTWSEVF